MLGLPRLFAQLSFCRRTSRRARSMVWFCHDVIYGKTLHVNEVDLHYFITAYVFCFLWLVYMQQQFMERVQNFTLIWNVQTMNNDDERIVETAAEDKDKDGFSDNKASIKIKGTRGEEFFNRNSCILLLNLQRVNM